MSKPTPHNLRDMFGYLGETGVKEMGFKMYSRVWKDVENPWFSGQFIRSAPFEHAARQLVLFIGQQVGGGDMWGGFRQDPKNIIGIHRNFVCGPLSKDRWIGHMEAALSEMELMPHSEEAKAILLKWFNAFASQVVNADEETERCYMAWVDYEIRVNKETPEKATVIGKDHAFANKNDYPPPIPDGTPGAASLIHRGPVPAPNPTVPQMTPRFNKADLLAKAGCPELGNKSTKEAFDEMCHRLEAARGPR